MSGMGAGVNKVATVAMVSVVLLGTSALGYGVARAASQYGGASQAELRAGTSSSRTTAPTARPSETELAQRQTGQQAADRAPKTVRVRQVSAPLPAVRPRAIPEPGPRILGPGDSGDKVRELQARLRQIAWYFGDVTDDYGNSTTAAVKGFQEKRQIAVTGEVDQRTLNRLQGMTRMPTADELANKLPGSTSTDAPLDPRCSTGRAMCVDKSSSTVRWVVDGKVLRTMAVRFGASYTPTREGLFHVGWKSRDHVSKLYDSPMPFAMFFSGGQAVHYSSDFAARGYAGASHGCVNVRDLAGIQWLFDQVALGDKVVIYWS
jgi:L,D-transpeptidase catalytic domain/Putative peptidoglycan binding domain